MAAATASPPRPSTRSRWFLHAVTAETEDTVLRFLVGGFSGATAKTIIAPLDRVKIIFQISHIPFSLRAVWQELSRTWREEGMRALFRGNAAQILRVYPYSGIQLMAYDQYAKVLLAEKRALQKIGLREEAGACLPVASSTRTGKNASAQLGPLERMMAGSAAGATSVAATYPLDCLRARLAVQQESSVPGTTRYRGVWHAYQSMVAEQGFFSLYRGITPTLLGIVPYAGISFATYESLKAYSAENRAAPVPDWQRLLFGGVAGLAGQASTYPLDIVRRRMQTDGFTPLHAHAQTAPPPSGQPASRRVIAAFQTLRARGRAGGMLDVLGRILDKEGIRALFKGLSMNAIKGPIAVGVSFTTYDTLKRLLDLEGSGGMHG